ncbi:transcriptional regulator [Xanthomonas citri pv. vignicola]|nr:transcriptional regulator [Xanthomonas citri pv. vignicola]
MWKPATSGPGTWGDSRCDRGRIGAGLKTAKQSAEVLGIPAAFLYTEDELLAQLLLQWNDLSVRQKKDLLKGLEKTPAKREPRKGR